MKVAFEIIYIIGAIILFCVFLWATVQAFLPKKTKRPPKNSNYADLEERLRPEWEKIRGKPIQPPDTKLPSKDFWKDHYKETSREGSRPAMKQPQPPHSPIQNTGPVTAATIKPQATEQPQPLQIQKPVQTPLKSQRERELETEVKKWTEIWCCNIGRMMSPWLLSRQINAWNEQKNQEYIFSAETLNPDLYSQDSRLDDRQNALAGRSYECKIAREFVVKYGFKSRKINMKTLMSFCRKPGSVRPVICSTVALEAAWWQAIVFMGVVYIQTDHYGENWKLKP